jgi:hypothetical protein
MAREKEPMIEKPAENCLIKFGDHSWGLTGPQLASIRLSGLAIADLADVMDAAFSEPVGFTRLDQAIVPGDTVALAVDPALPAAVSVIAETCHWIVEHGTAPENVRAVMAADNGLMEELERELTRKGLKAVQLELHDPDDSQRVSYVAADDEAQPIYINRTLVDADVVVPISSIRSGRAIDYLGSFSSFPWFSNRETMARLLNYFRLIDNETRARNQSQVQQAAWWLGILIGVQVLPAAEDRVAAIRCGLLEELESTCQRMLGESISGDWSAGSESELVIAVIDARYQDWTTVARGLHGAKQYCSQGGAIVLCTQLEQSVGSALRSLSKAEHRDRQRMEKRLSKEWSADALMAGLLMDASQDHHIYLVSRHRDQVIEELGMAVIADSKQLASLVGQFSRGLVLHSAQHLQSSP